MNYFKGHFFVKEPKNIEECSILTTYKKKEIRICGIIDIWNVC